MPSGTFNKSEHTKHPLTGADVEIASSSIIKVNTVCPDFAKVKKLGQRLPCLSYFFSKVELKYPLMRVARDREFDNLHFVTYDSPRSFVNAFADVTYSTEDAAIMDRNAIRKLYDGLKTYNSNVGLIGAEAHKTMDLITTTATRLGGAFHALKHGNVSKAFQALGVTNLKHEKRLRSLSRTIKDPIAFASKAYLELAYGWKPLLYDVYTAAGDVAKRNLKKDFDCHIHSQYSFSSSVKIKKLTGVGADISKLNFTSLGGNSATERIRYDVFMRLTSASLRTNANLGLTNPLSLAWELLPYSFVVDWFAPVGPWLDSFSALDGLLFADGSKSIMQKSKYTIAVTGSQKSDSTAIIATISGVGWYDENKVKFERIKLSSFPSYPSPIAFEGLRKALRADRPLKALALMASRFLR